MRSVFFAIEGVISEVFYQYFGGRDLDGSEFPNWYSYEDLDCALCDFIKVDYWCDLLQFLMTWSVGDPEEAFQAMLAKPLLGCS